jgi:hypothetical protein
MARELAETEKDISWQIQAIVNWVQRDNQVESA